MKKIIIVLLSLACCSFNAIGKEPFDTLNKRCIALDKFKISRDYAEVMKYYHPKAQEYSDWIVFLKKRVDKYANKREQSNSTEVKTAVITRSEFRPVTKKNKHKLFKISKILSVTPEITYKNSELIYGGLCRFAYDEASNEWYMLNI